MQAVFPRFNEWIDRLLPDPRREHPSKRYPFRFLIWQAMALFICQSGSRKQYDSDCRKSQAFLAHLTLLAGLDEPPDCMPIAETMDDLLKQVDPIGLNSLRKEMVVSLIRAKRLDLCRWGDYWLLAVDATGIYTSKKRHCPHCLTKKNSKTGEITYSHNVLEFKLVSPCGLAISIYSEFIINQDGDSKQDSETKAFYRGAVVVKEMYPHMLFLLLGDGIYASAPVMAKCKKYNWAYCVSLKDNLPTLLAAARRQMTGMEPTLHFPDKNVRQEIRWAEGLTHDGNPCHALACDETKPSKKGTMKTTRFLWVTNLSPSKHNPVKLANGVGRQRWKIENQGFKTQKRHGYNIEHGYGVMGHAWKNYYIIAQIVHIIMQLVMRTDALHKLPKLRVERSTGAPPTLLTLFETMKNFFKKLSEALRGCMPAWRSILDFAPFQLRFLNTG